MSVMKVKYVSRKIGKIRWKPKSFSTFVTGSYDDERNCLGLWKFPEESVKDMDDEDIIAENEPILISSEEFAGDVTDIKIVSDELLFASSSFGSLSTYKYTDEKLNCIYEWKYVHRRKRDTAAINAIATKGQEVATVGEDGRLCVFNFSQMQKVHDIECPDLCNFTCVGYIRHQELVAGNSLGYLRVWDLRSPKNVVSSTLIHSRNQSGIASLAIHPTQGHVLATGNEDGSMNIWDMRQDKHPTAILEGHSLAVSELLFHPSQPDFLFTCSLDGTVLQWDSSALRNSYGAQHPLSTPTGPESQSAASNPWLSCETNKHRLEITSLFSQPTSCVNCLDCSGSMLLWVTDNEAIHLCNDVLV